jgi:uncharacterized protein
MQNFSMDKLNKPILLGGLGLCAGLLGWDSLHHHAADFGELISWGALAAGGGYWWLTRQANGNPALVVDSKKVDLATIERTIQQIEIALQQLSVEGGAAATIAQLQQSLAKTRARLTSKVRQVAILGGAKVGKTTLFNALQKTEIPTDYQLEYTDTPSLFGVGEEAEKEDVASCEASREADLNIFLVNGDITATEYKKVLELTKDGEVVLALSQQDRYLPDDRSILFQKVSTTLREHIPSEKVIPIAASPAAIKVRQVGEDNTTIAERTEIPPVELDALTAQLGTILATEGERIGLTTGYRQVLAIKGECQSALNTLRRQKALATIDRYQWIAAAAAFANPLPAIDLLATAAINGQMVVDLGGIYQQKFTLEHAKTATVNLGEVILKLGVIEVCTQAVSTVLKTNLATYAAGGLIQGASAAYLTHIAGITLVEYFESQDIVIPTEGNAWDIARLSETFQKVFTANQRMPYFQTLVERSIGRLLPNSNAV